MSIEIPAVSHEQFKIFILDDRVVLEGHIMCRNPEAYMSDFFKKLHNDLVESNIKEVNVDFSNLHFLNSSGIKVFAEWITRINDLNEEKRYHIKFLCNHNHLWQESTLTTLTFLCPNIIDKEFII